jgi:PPIC-type PPIASE domain
MSTPLAEGYSSLPVAPDATSAAPRRMRLRPPDWLREPLLHFALLGGALFALDYYLVSRSEDPQAILVSSEVNSEAAHTFERARGRKPTDKELHALHRVWLDNEVLYREGLALGVDKGDPAIRERVIFKALSVVDSNTKVAPADEKTLRAWFESRREKYDEPARYDFEEGALSNNSSEDAVRSFVKDLNAGTPGDAKAGLRVFKARPHQNLVDSYGPDFARALEQSKPGEWQALQTRDGWRAIRLTAITAPRPAVFESIRGVVLRDWTDAEASKQRSAAVRALSKKYTIKFEDAHQCAADEQ